MAKAKLDSGTEKAILEAALLIFTRKGFAAARMDDIAREAGINRALLHYYFRSKDKLFDLVFAQRIQQLLKGMGAIVAQGLPVKETIRAMVEHDIEMVRANPDLPLFILQELHHNPERLVALATQTSGGPHLMLKMLRAQVKSAVERGEIKPIDGGQLLINIIAMSIYPFVARPMVKAVLELDESQFDKMVTKRKKEVADFILDALKP
jgi:TetR/AcrR family transcriptional regulator